MRCYLLCAVMSLGAGSIHSFLLELGEGSGSIIEDLTKSFFEA